MKTGIYITLLAIFIIAFGYLVCVGLASLIFWLLEIGGLNIEFSSWVAGGILYILWALFGKSN